MKLKGDRTLLIFWATVMLVLFRPELHGFDTVAYYSWLRSAVIRGTLDVTETFAHYGYLGERGFAPTGYRLNEWPVGPAILWLPFFLAGHLMALVANVLGLAIPADGFSPPYLALTALGSSLYGLGGLILLRRLMLTVAGPDSAFWAVLGIWLASPLVFYMSAHPFMAHAPDFFLNTLFLWLWVRARGSAWRRRLGLGLVGGLAASVRYQNATLLLWPALEDLTRVRQGLRHSLVPLGVLAIGTVFGFLPQLVVWRVVFGDWLVPNPYGVTGAGSFDLRSPHLLGVLFSTDRGLLPWMPLSALGLWGLAGPLLRHPALARIVGAQFLAQVYIVGSWSSWSGGAAFGPRLLVGLLPGLGLGLAALYEGWIRRGRTAAVACCTLAFVAWNLILLARYGLGDVPHAGPISPEHFWLGQLAFLVQLPGRLGILVDGLLRRGP